MENEGIGKLIDQVIIATEVKVCTEILETTESKEDIISRELSKELGINYNSPVARLLNAYKHRLINDMKKGCDCGKLVDAIRGQM